PRGGRRNLCRIATGRWPHRDRTVTLGEPDMTRRSGLSDRSMSPRCGSMGGMASPDRPDEGHIADTGMFRRFVAEESELEQQEAARTPRWVLPTVIVLLVIVVAL